MIINIQNFLHNNCILIFKLHNFLHNNRILISNIDNSLEISISTIKVALFQKMMGRATIFLKTGEEAHRSQLEERMQTAWHVLRQLQLNLRSSHTPKSSNEDRHCALPRKGRD